MCVVWLAGIFASLIDAPMRIDGKILGAGYKVIHSVQFSCGRRPAIVSDPQSGFQPAHAIRHPYDSSVTAMRHGDSAGMITRCDRENHRRRTD
jgi:hypothetical protein